MEKKSRNIGDILSTITIAVLFLVIILLVVFSASAYRNGTESKNDNDNNRAILSYVVTAVKDNITNKISIKDFGGVKGIAIEDKDEGYERKIFVKDGKLMEEYSDSGSSVSADNALVIGKIKKFEPEYIEKNMMRIRTDIGTSYVKTKK